MSSDDTWPKKLEKKAVSKFYWPFQYEFEYTMRLMIPLILRSVYDNNRWRRIDVIVDAGADCSIFPKSVCTSLNYVSTHTHARNLRFNFSHIHRKHWKWGLES